MLKGKKTYNLVVRNDEQTGEDGWVVEELAIMDEQSSVANEGPLIAHDIIEHVNGIEAIGGIGEELQAMGGAWNTRGQFGDIRRNTRSYTSPEQSIAYSIADLGRRFIVDGEEIGADIPPLVKSEFDEEFKEIWELAKKSIPNECDFDEDDEIDIEGMLEEFKQAAESFFHLGVIKHQEQWEEGQSANTMFYEIVEALKNYNAEEDFLTLTLDYDDESVTVYRTEEEYEYEEDEEEDVYHQYAV